MKIMYLISLITTLGLTQQALYSAEKPTFPGTVSMPYLGMTYLQDLTRPLVSIEEANQHYEARLRELLEPQLPGLKAKETVSILSFACGQYSEHDVLKNILETNTTFVGVDSDQHALEKAIEAYPDDRFEKTCPDERFDIIIFRHPPLMDARFTKTMIHIMNQHLAQKGVIVISNHYNRELKTLAKSLPSHMIKDITYIQPSNSAPHQVEYIANYFQTRPTQAVLFYDRFMSAIFNYTAIELDKETSPQPSTPRFSNTGGFGF